MIGEVAGIVGGALAVALFLAIMTFRRLICICQPNEALIFSGGRRTVSDRDLGYRVIIGGRKMRIPLLERVDRMDLTNMIIDVHVTNAYAKGGVPLTVQGVANIKVASHEPALNRAIERFLGRSRKEIIGLARATLEGSLRGVLSTMTPLEVNEDKTRFSEELVHEAEHDMGRLGLMIDTLKIQNISDEVGFLDAIGRIMSSNILRDARIAEAEAKAKALIQAAKNREAEMTAKIQAATDVAKADAGKRLTDARTRRAALVAEENAVVSAAVVQAKAEIGVQTARIEQVRLRLEADVIQPAKAACESAEANARADAAPIIANGKARADALRILTDAWQQSGENARSIFLLQKLDPIVKILTSTISEARIKNLTIIDSDAPNVTNDGAFPRKLYSSLEQLKELLGVDVTARLAGNGSGA